MKTTDNTVLITGGTSGIGLGLARRLHDAGNRVIVAGRRKHLLDAIVAEHPGIESLVLDVADPASIVAAFAEATSRFPDLNVLINNAGIMATEDLRSGRDLQVAEATVATNLLGPIRMVAAFTPWLIGKAGATIVNVTSGLAYVPLPAAPTYSATKAAIHSFTESLRVQLASSGVQVVELAPPAVGTTLLGMDENPHAMPPEEFYSEVMDLLAAEPDAQQVLVERVGRQRFARERGAYAEVLASQSAMG